MAELADAPDLGSGELIRGGSSPFTCTILFKDYQIPLKWYFFLFVDLEESSTRPYLILYKEKYLSYRNTLKKAINLIIAYLVTYLINQF